MVTAPATAAAQDRTPTPSARELWRTYPLEQQPAPATPTAASPTTPAPDRRTSAPAAGSGDDDALLRLLGIAGALVGLAGALVVARRRSARGTTTGFPAGLAAPLLAAAATATTSDGRRRSPRLTALAAGPGAGRDERGDSAPETPAEALHPPDPEQPWTAELEWRHEDDGARFCVVARPADGGSGVVIAASEPLEWPPADAPAVRQMRRAVARVESALRGSGWTPLPPGSAWYAKRFAWAPVAEPAGTGRFSRQTEWPPGAEDLWRCEIKWQAGYVNSRFGAVAHEPGRKRGTTVGTSDVFKWLLMADPEPQTPEFRVPLQRLHELLLAAGWEPAGRGRKWYALRYVWRHDGPPPEDLGSAPARISGARGDGDDEAG
jgi:hypothetical protein